MIEERYQTLNDAFEHTQSSTDKATGYVTEDDNKPDINISSIISTLIQNAGHFCEHYASDVIYDIEAMERYIEDTTIDNDEKLFAFGIRKSGVDGCEYITCRLNDATCPSDYYKLCKDYYRKIFAVKITKSKRTITCEMKDIASML